MLRIRRALGTKKEEPKRTVAHVVEKPDTVQARPVITRPVYVPMKDPSLATVLSFLIPGGGQMYAGKGNKGVGIFLGSAAASGLAIKFAMEGVDTNCGNSGPCRVEAEMGGAWLMIGTAGVFWFYGLVTAADDARAYNVAHGFAVAPTVIESRPGLRLAWRP